MPQAPEVSVVVPVKDEAGNIRPLVEEIRGVLEKNPEIVYVDDGSRDETAEILSVLSEEIPNLKVLRHRKNCGQSQAVATGVKAATAPVIVTLDGDRQNDPADIPKLLEAYRASPRCPEVLIIGDRQTRRDPRIKRVASKVANAVRRCLLHDDTPDSGCGLKVFSREVFLDLPQFDHMHRFLPALMLRCGASVVSVPVDHRCREWGTSKYGLWDRLKVGIPDLLGVMWLIRRGSRPRIEPGEKKE